MEEIYYQNAVVVIKIKNIQKNNYKKIKIIVK